MDGTLIAPSTHHFLPSSIQAIQQAIRQGCHVFLCTGRGYKMALEYQNELEIPGVIFSNGAGIAYQGKILETTNIAPETVTRMTEMVSLLHVGESFRIQNGTSYSIKTKDTQFKVSNLIHME